MTTRPQLRSAVTAEVITRHMQHVVAKLVLSGGCRQRVGMCMDVFYCSITVVLVCHAGATTDGWMNQVPICRESNTFKGSTGYDPMVERTP